MHDILITWLTDIVRYIIARNGGGEWAGPLSLKLLGTWRDYAFGVDLGERCKDAIRAGRQGDGRVDTVDTQVANDLLNRMRLEFKDPHDVLVAWIQDLLAYLSHTTN